LRRDEVVTLADIGALNAFGYDRRSALWQAERAVRPAGELFTTINASLDSARDALSAVEWAETAEIAELLGSKLLCVLPPPLGILSAELRRGTPERPWREGGCVRSSWSITGGR
jgi:hypothetical protein